MHPQTSCVILRADDVGLSIGTNLAVRDLVLAGAVCNVGLMANGPALQHAAETLQPLSDRICFGVHAVLTSEFISPRGRPLLPPESVPGLVQPDGTFFPAVADWAGKVPADRIRCELEAQIEGIRSAGFTPAYLDAHMGFQWVEGLDVLLRQICREQGLVYGDEFPKLNADNEMATESVPHVRVSHPAYPDATCPHLILCETGRDLLPERTEEARHLLAYAQEFPGGRRFSEFLPPSEQPFA